MADEFPNVMNGVQARRFLGGWGKVRFNRFVRNGWLPSFTDEETGVRCYPKAALEAALVKLTNDPKPGRGAA